MAPKKQSFRPWPKRHDGIRLVYDRDKLKELYLKSNHYSWQTFCEEQGFSPSHRFRLEFPVKSWQQEKLQMQVNLKDEGLIRDAMDLRTFIGVERLSYVRDWNQQAKDTLKLVNYIEARAARDINHDIQNDELIQKGVVKPKFNLSTAQVAFLAQTKKTLMDIHRSALLMPAAEAYQAVVQIKTQDAENTHAEAEGERLRNISTKLISGEGVHEQAVNEMMNRWIDQQAKPMETEESEADDLDIPLTPLGSEA